MRVLLVSDGPMHHTGYGIQTDKLCRAMAADGHRVFVFSPGAFHEGAFEWCENVTVVGSSFGDDRWGNASLPHYIDTLKPDLILTWLDCQGLENYGWATMPTYMWAPIDLWPVAQQEIAILNRAAKILVPSRWGVGVLEKQGVKSEYVPCGVDFDVFDIDEEGGRNWRSKIKPEMTDDTFLIGMVGLNTGSPDRKGYGYAFDVIKRFTDAHKDEDIRVYIHTNDTPGMGAIDLRTLRDELGLQHVVCFPPPFGPLGATSKYMRDMYNGFDVLLHTAATEGFGVPVVEAQACGTPVVVNAATSVTELAKHGYQAKPLADMIINTTSRVAIPDVRSLYLMLETAYARRKEESRIKIRAGVQQYSFDGWYDTYWKSLLDAVPAPIDYEKDAGPRKLMLAAGSNQREGYVHHDREKLWPHIDVAHDLNNFPWPFEDSSFDYVEFTDCLEHLKASLPEVMDELWRICDGYVYIHTAQIGTWQLYKDPTHLQGFDLEAMDYFDPDTRWGETYSYSNKKWKVVKKTTDGQGGLIFVLKPRKEQEIPTAHEFEAVPA